MLGLSNWWPRARCVVRSPVQDSRHSTGVAFDDPAGRGQAAARCVARQTPRRAATILLLVRFGRAGVG